MPHFPPVASGEADERLRRSEELLRSAQEVSRIGSWEWELGTGHVTWSDQLYRIFGVEPGAPVDYRRYFEAVHPDDRAALERAIDAGVAGQPFQVEHRIIRPDGRERWLLCSGGRLPASGTRPARLLGTAQDVTERREADEVRWRLAESESARRQAESILDTIGELFLACDRELRFTFVNARAVRYLEELGLTRADVIGRPVRQALPELVRTPFYRAAMRALREDRIVEVEARFDLVDRWFAARIVPTDDGLVSYARDITQRKLAEAAARASHELLQAVFDGTSESIFVKNLEGRYLLVNRASARDFGRPVEEIVGRTDEELFDPETAAQYRRNDAVVLAGGGTHTFEEAEHGSGHVYLTTKSALRGPDGRITGLVGVSRDVTVRNRAEEQLRQAQKMEAVGRLAGGLAHDFNNMLMIIIGFSDLLHAALGTSDPRQADAEEIRRAAERASALTQQLLAFARDDMLPRRPLDLNAIIRGVEGMLRPVLGEHITLVTALDAGLAPVQGDQGQLEQVLMNLALNARDAMPRGGRLTIETANVEFAPGYAYRTFGVDLPAGRYVMLVVSDTGAGMDAATRAKIFEPFFTTKTSGGNSGLGLATVYAIVTRDGGSIWVDSEPGRGTTFTLCFAPAEIAAAGAPEPARGELRGGTETVLIVEDETAVRRLACRVLRDYGYDVVEAANGREALDRLAELGREVHLVVSDVVMPVMNGRELGEHLEQLHPGLPVLYMSGYTDGEIETLGVETGATNFLPKPFAPEALVARVREMLDAAGVRVD